MAEASQEAIRIFLDVEDELVDSSRTDRSCVRMDFADLPLTFRWRLPNHFVGVLWWMPGREPVSEVGNTAPRGGSG